MSKDEQPKLMIPNAGPSNEPRTFNQVLEAMFPNRVITHENMPRRNQSIFDRPEQYMREVEKGYKYAWPKYDRHMRAKLRTGEYVLVDPSELREDCPLALDKKEISGEEVVQMGDLILVKVPPEHAERLYVSRALEGYMNSQSNLTSYVTGMDKILGEGSTTAYLESGSPQ